MICGSGGWKSRLAKVVCGASWPDERWKNCTRVARSHFEVKMYKTPLSDHFCKLRCRTSARRCGAKHIIEVKMLKTLGVRDHVWKFRCRFAWQAQGIVHSSIVSKTWGLCSIPKRWQAWDIEEDLQRCIFRAGAVQKTCLWEMLGGQGADFLRGVAFWSIKSVGLLRWFCVTGAALRMTWHHFFVAAAVL